MATEADAPSGGSAPEKKDGPTSTTLILVRHAKTPTTGTVLPGRAAGLSISDDGILQAKAIPASLAQVESISAIYSSPLERARETAEPLASVRGLDVQVDERLVECDFGDWTGRRLDELSKLPEWKAVQGAPSKFRFPHGESFREMSERMINFLDWVHLTHRGQCVAAFSHADPIKALVAHCLGIHLDSFQRIVISTTGLSAISITDTANYALFVNLTPTPNLKVT